MRGGQLHLSQKGSPYDCHGSCTLSPSTPTLSSTPPLHPTPPPHPSHYLPLFCLEANLYSPCFQRPEQALSGPRGTWPSLSSPGPLLKVVVVYDHGTLAFTHLWSLSHNDVFVLFYPVGLFIRESPRESIKCIDLGCPSGLEIPPI